VPLFACTPHDLNTITHTPACRVKAEAPR
jgi:hypothetical protein